MKFTILSHAGLCVEHNGVQIVCDPWLLGSCYWRSWWNFPEPPAELIKNLQPDYIYLTHLHWDHFHGATLKKLFPRTTRMLVPKVPTTRMLRDLAWLGFENVTEIPHGGHVQLGDDFALHSYQFDMGVDSSALLAGGGYVLFNANDCKSFGLPLKQITDRFKKIDFVFRSHSSASAIPYCIDGYETAFQNLRSQQDYMEEFSRFALHVGARYAIPFASNHCFLHRDTFHFNRMAVSPHDLPTYYQRLAAQSNRKSECIVMAPGSTWSDREGFKIVPFDYSKREEYLQELLTRHGSKLAQQYEKEEQTIADFDSFRTYFEGFLKAIPWPVRKGLRLCVVFQTHDARGEHNWLVDMGKGSVEVLSSKGNECVVVETPPVVLNDCTSIWLFSSWTASKRLKIQLPTPAHLKSLRRLFLLLDWYELETLPLKKNFTARALAVRLRRWRDVVEAGRLFWKHVVAGRPLDTAALYHVPARMQSQQE